MNKKFDCFFTYNKAFLYFALPSIKGDGGEPNAMEEKKEQNFVKWYQAKKV